MKQKDISKRFRLEVLDNGPDSTLPCNLSDEWVTILSLQMTEIVEGRERSIEPESVLALIHVLRAKFSQQQVSIGHKELFDYFQQYRLELAFEEVRRHSDLPLSRATIDTIFTDRDLALS